MDRVTKQRDPKRQAAGRKGHEKYMAKLKEDILKNVVNGNSNTTNDSTNGGINTTTTTTTTTNNGTTTTNSGSTITNFSCIHGVGAIVVLSLGVYIFIKLMRNLPQPDKDPKKISKDTKKISKIRRKML